MKKCSKCKKIKQLSDFYKFKNSKDGHQCYCKLCNNKNVNDYFKSKKGLICSAYKHQKQSSIQRNHPMPNYSKQQLIDWCLSQKIFHVLHRRWVDNNYNKYIMPSLDRLNDYKPYTLDNLQIITWYENVRKGADDRLNGINNKQSKAVIKYTKEGLKLKEYYSMAYAQRQTGINVRGIRTSCNNNRYSAGGFIWRYKN